MNPLPESSKDGSGKDFGRPVILGYTPGYTEKPKPNIEIIKDPELKRLIELWPHLPEYLRKTISTLLDSSVPSANGDGRTS